jgi:hypothetical protein
MRRRRRRPKDNLLNCGSILALDESSIIANINYVWFRRKVDAWTGL